jgi:hypothetical protein
MIGNIATSNDLPPKVVLGMKVEAIFMPHARKQRVQAHGAAGIGAMTRQRKSVGHSAKYFQHNMGRSEQPPSP